MLNTASWQILVTGPAFLPESSNLLKTSNLNCQQSLSIKSSNPNFNHNWTAALWEIQLQSSLGNLAAFLPDNSTVISTSDTGHVHFWHTSSGKHIKTIKGHSGSITCMDISKNGAYLVTGSDEGVIEMWDLFGNSLIYTMENGHMPCVTCVQFSPIGDLVDSGLIVAGSTDRLLRIWQPWKRPLHHYESIMRGQ